MAGQLLQNRPTGPRRPPVPLLVPDGHVHHDPEVLVDSQRPGLGLPGRAEYGEPGLDGGLYTSEARAGLPRPGASERGQSVEVAVEAPEEVSGVGGGVDERAHEDAGTGGPLLGEP